VIIRIPFLLLQIITPIFRPKAEHSGYPETALALPRMVVTPAPIQSIRKPGPSSVAQRCSLPKTDRIQSFFLSCIQAMNGEDRDHCIDRFAEIRQRRPKPKSD
jgi:hypothetical protein